jgi:hypothetical protein
MSTNRRSATAGLALAVTGIVIGALLLLLFTVIGFATAHAPGPLRRQRPVPQGPARSGAAGVITRRHGPVRTAHPPRDPAITTIRD